MTRLAPLLAVAVTFAGLACLSQPARADDVPRIQAAHWLRKPDGADIAAAYPERAKNCHVSGRATLHCGVKADGTLTDCSVVFEDPQGDGFGGAALSLARRFRMAPTMPDGRSVAGGVVNIPIIFNRGS